MNEFDAVVRRRTMTRSFTGEPVDAQLLLRLVDLAARAPSAGKTQGWHLVVLEGAETDRYWRHAFPVERRGTFAFPGLFRAPVIALPYVDPNAYVVRYREPDKQHTGLGSGVDVWSAPYWTIDGSMAVMTLLLAAEAVGLGALFFAASNGDAVRAELGVPDHLELLGAIALGWPDRTAWPAGRSAGRPRRSPEAIIHRNGW